MIEGVISSPLNSKGDNIKELNWNINDRFVFLKKLTKMTAMGETQSLLVTGEGGLGKTFTVKESLKESNIDPSNVLTIKGYSTARGLYNTLHDNRDKLIIFDDCDSILKDKVALNILKGALDSYDERIITWSSNMLKSSEYASEFEFTGSIIFISNIKKDKIDQAIISRSMVVDLSMTVDDKIKRMYSVLDYVCESFHPITKLESMNLINKYKNEIKDLNFRTLIKVCKIRNSYPEDWENLAKYSMIEC